MQINCVKKGLKLHLNLKGQLILTVEGNSMLPVLTNGDHIKIIKTENILVGDVVVFIYREELLVHRILQIKNEVICCKGDNSFRLEKIKLCDIVGKVVSIVVNNTEIKLKRPENDFIKLSYAVGREFIKVGYNTEKIFQSEVFLRYQVYFENINVNNRSGKRQIS